MISQSTVRQAFSVRLGRKRHLLCDSQLLVRDGLSIAATELFFFSFLLTGVEFCFFLYRSTSTLGGESGSADTARDPRGFAVKFYTEDGNWDLVGNNTPIFFIRDPIFVSE